MSAIELDPWGGNTTRNSNASFQPRSFTTYERDGNGADEAMFRRYNRWWSRFDQPDPYDGSYDLTNPQSFNRYAYVQNEPVNSMDPNGLVPCTFDAAGNWCIGDGGRPIDIGPYARWTAYFEPGEIGLPFGGFAGTGGLGGIGTAIGNPQNVTPISSEELGRIRSDVETAISAKKCADFLRRLLDEAAVQTGEPYRDIMVTFDNTKFFFGGTGPYGGLAPGSFEDGSAKANLFQFENNFISVDRSSFIRTQTAQNALGETLHHVGTHKAYDDAAMANALNAIYVRQGKEPKKTFLGRTELEIQTASIYWHPRVFDACSMRY